MILQRPTADKTKTLRRTITTHPAIWPILARAQQLRRGDWRGFTRLSAQLRRFVGWGATDPDLATAEAYETAHQALADAMGRARRW
jgi:hypothetical protein